MTRPARKARASGESPNDSQWNHVPKRKKKVSPAEELWIASERLDLSLMTRERLVQAGWDRDRIAVLEIASEMRSEMGEFGIALATHDRLFKRFSRGPIFAVDEWHPTAHEAGLHLNSEAVYGIFQTAMLFYVRKGIEVLAAYQLVYKENRFREDDQCWSVIFDEMHSRETQKGEAPTASLMSALIKLERAAAVDFLINNPVKVRKGPPQETLMNDKQIAILKALDGKALKGQTLADLLFAGDKYRLYKAHSLKELCEIGLVVNASGIGYYRPDRPPEHLRPPKP